MADLKGELERIGGGAWHQLAIDRAMQDGARSGETHRTRDQRFFDECGHRRAFVGIGRNI